MARPNPKLALAALALALGSTLPAAAFADDNLSTNAQASLPPGVWYLPLGVLPRAIAEATADAGAAAPARVAKRDDASLAATQKRAPSPPLGRFALPPSRRLVTGSP
ncbi:MAG: hypothetical protein ACREM8_10095 [Vulcanimicrobiaceae bacterium]